MRCLKLVQTLTILSIFQLGLLACSSTPIDNDSPAEAQYTEGERLMEKDRYLEAVERFRILKNRWPYSKYAAQATLRIGDAHFADEAYIEAASAYKIFRDLYPKHESAAYALFRIGESNYNQLPSTIDRDLEPANAALSAYDDLIKSYPNYADISVARKRIDDLKQRLAEKEEYVANFYFVREFYGAALGRYRNILDQYPLHGFNEKALYRLAYCYEKTGDYVKAEEAIERLKFEFPNTKFLAESDGLLKKIQKEKIQ
jgi:outer membrane protein assembly factor BamD